MQALIVLGGDEMPFAELIKESDIIICADSGADSALNQSIVPDVLIGDMDSVTDKTYNELKSKKVEIITFPAEKDKTDGEIALDCALKKGADSIIITCAEGSIDHYLGNLYLLLYAKKIGLDARLETSDMKVIASSGKTYIDGEEGTRVSVLPADGEIIVMEPYGLYYKLEEPTKMLPGQTLGLGNHMVEKECLIDVTHGTAFIFIEKNN